MLVSNDGMKLLSSDDDVEAWCIGLESISSLKAISNFHGLRHGVILAKRAYETIYLSEL
jgi:hypothetical protein